MITLSVQRINNYYCNQNLYLAPETETILLTTQLMGLTQCIKLIYILQVLHLVAFVFQVCELMMQLLQQPLGHSENTGIHIRERIDLKGAFTSCFVSHFDTNIFKGILEGKLVFIYVSQQPYTRRMESSQDSTFHQIQHQPTM